MNLNWLFIFNVSDFKLFFACSYDVKNGLTDLFLHAVCGLHMLVNEISRFQ